jgi:hypothetical protein
VSTGARRSVAATTVSLVGGGQQLDRESLSEDGVISRSSVVSNLQVNRERLLKRKEIKEIFMRDR